MAFIRKVFGPPSLVAVERRARTRLAAGDFERAQHIVKEGLQDYPGARVLEDIGFTIRRAQARAGIRSLRRRLERDGAPRAYEELIALYLELGMLTEARREATDYAVSHAGRDTPHLLLGEMSLRRFLDELQARDAHEARDRLHRAAQLNAQAIKPRLLLAELYYCVGADRALFAMAAEIESLAGETSDLEPVLAQVRDLDRPSGPEALDGLFERVEIEGRLHREPGTWPIDLRHSPASEVNEERARRATERLVTEGTASEVVLLRHSGSLIAHAGGGEADAKGQGLVGVARTVAQTVSHYARDLDLGAFKRCTIQGEFGLVAVGDLAGIVAGARWRRSPEPQRLWARIALAVEGALGRSR